MVCAAMLTVSNLATQERTMSAPTPDEQPAGTTPVVSGVMPTFAARERATTELDVPLSTIARACLPLTLMGTTILFSFSIGNCSAFESQYARETPLQSSGRNRRTTPLA